MMIEWIVIRYILSMVCFIVIGIIFFKQDNKDSAFRRKIDKKHVNEESFQNYAKFLGETVPTDVYFDQKLQTIYRCIIKDNMTDIKAIASKSSCALTECILKIKYLKNKRLIGDYYIDTTHFQLLPCSMADQALLDKYKPYVYGSHLQINEIANYVANPKYLSIRDLRNEVFQEIKYLYQKNLLNGLVLDEIDHKILYYSIEKRRNTGDYETIHCPNCGALNDVDKYGKCRCNYCKTILEGKEYREEVI